jgi:hypothetical protein
MSKKMIFINQIKIGINNGKPSPGAADDEKEKLISGCS